MKPARRWIGPGDLGLLIDKYELNMVQAYRAAGMQAEATFSLYFRELPRARRFMLACGQQHAARLVTDIRFPRESLDVLACVDDFQDGFLRWLEEFRFTGDIVAMPEGTPVFPHEPLLEVTAPIAEAQLLETILMNLVHLETVLASKAARMVIAADGRPVVDFGMRRMYGLDAAVHGVRAYRTAGISGTSNVLAGREFGLPLSGTMAHSYVQAHDDESTAFREYAKLYPGTTLIVDTYDSLDGVNKVIALSRELGDDFRVNAIRLDSGDVAGLAGEARRRLDAGGLAHVKIFASGGLDEYRIASLVAAAAPIDAFGVGTALGTSADSPNLDLVYKMTSYDGRPRLKDSPGKEVYPGQKQVYRFRDRDGITAYDELTLREERRGAEVLLQPVVTGGESFDTGASDLEETAARARREIDALPERFRALDTEPAAFDVRISDDVQDLRARTLSQLRSG